MERRIRRFERELADIDQFFYLGKANANQLLYASMLERKRDDVVRGIVLQMHTSIEDVLNELIICRLLYAKPTNRGRKIQSQSGKAIRRMLYGAGSLGFDMKLNFAVALRIINAKTRTHLMELNTLRNRCSHNWLLKLPVRRGRRPAQKKPPLLLYNGRDLHGVAALYDFTAEYGAVYAKLVERHLST